MRLLRRCGLWIGFCLLLAAAQAADVPLRFDRIDLLDGRTLKQVEIKSYDAATGKLLLVADGSALVVPVDLIPAPFAARLKAAAPAAGSSTAIVATRTVTPVPAPGPAVQVVPMPAAPIGGRDPTADTERLLARHKQAAEARALRFYRYEFPAGSSAITVTAVDLETGQPEPVEGWSGRYRTKGTARLEFYDSKGGSFSRSGGAFEVLTEQKPGEALKVVAFTPK